MNDDCKKVEDTILNLTSNLNVISTTLLTLNFNPNALCHEQQCTNLQQN
jgi:hypothetical protein